MRFIFIRAEKANYPVACLCRVMAVSTSGYYAWVARAPSQRQERDRELTRKIQVIHSAHKRRYGSPRMHTDLRAQGEKVGKKRVERLMRQSGLQGQRPRTYRCTTNSKHTKKVAPNLLQQHFGADRPDRAWSSDIERHEALLNLAVMKGHRRRLVAASRQKLRAA